MVEVKSEPCLCCLWVDKWKFQFQYQEATRIVETPRESSRSPEKPREAMRKPEKPQAASRGLEKTREDLRKLYLGLLWISRRFVISSTVRMFASRASENYGWGVEEPNLQTEVKQGASSTLLDSIVTPIYFQVSLTCPRLATIYIYITWFCFILNIEKWLCRIAL